jgi:hypothetical protein
MTEEDDDVRRTNIGGRYGSPTFTIALPFGRVVNTDNDLRNAVADLAALVARLAAAGTDEAERAAIAVAAAKLATDASSTG